MTVLACRRVCRTRNVAPPSIRPYTSLLSSTFATHGQATLERRTDRISAAYAGIHSCQGAASSSASNRRGDTRHQVVRTHQCKHWNKMCNDAVTQGRGMNNDHAARANWLTKCRVYSIALMAAVFLLLLTGDSWNCSCLLLLLADHQLYNCAGG